MPDARGPPDRAAQELRDLADREPSCDDLHPVTERRIARPTRRPGVGPRRRAGSPSRHPARGASRPSPAFEADLSAPVLAAGTRIPNVRQISERVAMGRALWRELVVGFASQLGELRLGFTQLAALYVLADGTTTTVGTSRRRSVDRLRPRSRLVDGLVEAAARRAAARGPRGPAPATRRADAARPGPAADRWTGPAPSSSSRRSGRCPRAERALVAMGVAALATHAISRRGRLVRGGG